MIGKLKGTIDEIGEDHVVIDVPDIKPEPTIVNPVLQDGPVLEALALFA